MVRRKLTRVVAVRDVVQRALNGSVNIIVRVDVATTVGRLGNVACRDETSGEGEGGGDGEELHVNVVRGRNDSVVTFFLSMKVHFISLFDPSVVGHHQPSNASLKRTGEAFQVTKTCRKNS